MDERFRQRDEDHRAGGTPGGPQGGGRLEHFRADGQRFYRAGRDAIDNALTPGRSEAFLRANEQEGGQ